MENHIHNCSRCKEIYDGLCEKLKLVGIDFFVNFDEYYNSVGGVFENEDKPKSG